MKNFFYIAFSFSLFSFCNLQKSYIQAQCDQSFQASYIFGDHTLGCISTDDIPTNNVIDDVSFEVTDYIYARDNGQVQGSTNRPNGFQVGNLFEIFHSSPRFSELCRNFGKFQTIAGSYYLLQNLPEGMVIMQ